MASMLQLEQQMERRRREEGDGAEWKPLERGWCLGSEEFRAKLLGLMEPQLGEHHSGKLRHQSAEAKAERIMVQELKRLNNKLYLARNVKNKK